LILILSAPEIATTANAVVHPYTRVEERAALVYVLHHKRPGDAVLVEWLGEAIALYYHETMGVNATGTFALFGSDVPCNNAAQLTKLKHWTRIWLVFGVDPRAEPNSIAQYTKAFASLGKVISAFYPPVHASPQIDLGGTAAALLLSNFHGSKPDDPVISAPSWQRANYGCMGIDLNSMAERLAPISYSQASALLAQGGGSEVRRSRPGIAKAEGGDRIGG
jgi:hypothetical protein